jgi:glyoxylase-like metal-dependent hydrolase (beta-lactamase superfamily II)
MFNIASKHLASNRVSMITMAFDRDKKWVMWEHENVKFWNGETLRVLEGATLIHLGGHFAGGQVLHWAEGVGGKGALFTGDILQVSSIAMH